MLLTYEGQESAWKVREMTLLILADIDDIRWKHGEGQADVVLSCGDVADQVILEAAYAYACSHIFAVKGNHDTNEAFPQPIIDLHLRVQKHNAIVFAGLNGSWRYKARGHFLYGQMEVQGFLEALPPVNVFLSHNSPRRIHDRDDEVHYGFEALNSYTQRTQPTLVIHGHQHVNMETLLEETQVVGVCGYRVIEI